MIKVLKNIEKTPYMIREIYEQAGVIEKMIERYVSFSIEKIKMEEFGFNKRYLHKIKRFIFLGCGSSANASLLGNYYFEEFTGKNCEYEYADEFISRRAILEPGTAVILISQSGKTRDVLIAAEIARKKGAFIIGVSNSKGSKLERMSDVFFDTRAREEKAIAATKSFSSQVLILFLMSLYFADVFNIEIKNRKEIFKEIGKLEDNIIKTLKLEKEIKKIAKLLAKKNNLVVTGRKYNFPICLEGAHKIKETAYIHAEGIASEELRHGGEAMLDTKFSIFCIIPTDSVYKENLVLLKELKKTKAPVYLFSNKSTKELQSLSKSLLVLPKVIEPLMPIVSVILFQLLAYYLAISKKIDINQPRNITKFVA